MKNESLILANPDIFLEHLLLNSIPEPNSGCLLWLRGCDGHGYGAFDKFKKRYRAHRVSLTLKLRRPIRPGFSACHKCDVPGCIRDDHLFEGTHRENIQDSCLKGRHKGGARGQDHGRARVTEAQVLAIRADARPLSQISKEYGISVTGAHLIRTRSSWKHLP